MKRFGARQLLSSLRTSSRSSNNFPIKKTIFNSQQEQQIQQPNYHVSLVTNTAIVDSNNVNRLHFHRYYWIYQQYREEITSRLNNLKSMYSYDHSQLYLKKEIVELEFELKEFDRLEMQFNQKANRLQFKVDTMEAKLEALGCDILHAEMMLTHLKNEFRFARTNDIIDSLRHKLDSQGYHLQNLKESKEYLAMDISDMIREIDSVTFDFVDNLERNLDGKISFFRYYYPTIIRSMLITCLIGFIVSYLYHAVGVSLELRLGGDDDEDEEEGDAKEESD